MLLLLLLLRLALLLESRERGRLPRKDGLTRLDLYGLLQVLAAGGGGAVVDQCHGCAAHIAVQLLRESVSACQSLVTKASHYDSMS